MEESIGIQRVNMLYNEPAHKILVLIASMTCLTRAFVAHIRTVRLEMKAPAKL